MPVFSPWAGHWLLNWGKHNTLKTEVLWVREEPELRADKCNATPEKFPKYFDDFWHPAFCCVWESPYVNIHRMELLQVLSVPKGTCSIKQAPGSSHHVIWSLTAVTCCFDASFSTRPPRPGLPRTHPDHSKLTGCSNKSGCTGSGNSVMKDCDESKRNLFCFCVNNTISKVSRLGLDKETHPSPTFLPTTSAHFVLNFHNSPASES